MVQQAGIAAIFTDDSPDEERLACQERLLPGVSRTFALTIPQLPTPLRIVVTNAYLLCRIADTIEDDGAMTHEEKRDLQATLLAVIRGDDSANEFTQACIRALDADTDIHERELVEQTGEVVALTHSFGESQRRAILRCLDIMCTGMSDFAGRRSVRGLRTMVELDRYCYVVAGCVGEMLTELFCAYSDEIAARRPSMLPLAKSFGQGLQMTNILKDIWDDRKLNACWLPRDVFDAHGLDIGDLSAMRHNTALPACFDTLIGIAHEHLRGALEYTKLVPRSETGIRNFCLWAIGLAILTLRKIHNHPHFASGQEVKVSRRALRGVIATSSALAGSNTALSLAFSMSALGLPCATAANGAYVLRGSRP